MKIADRRVYRGPNLYSLESVIRLQVDLEELEAFPTRKLGRFTERLLELVPSLHEHGCSYGVPGGFVRRMMEKDGTWLGHVLEHLAIELECMAGTPVTYGKTRSYELPEGQYYVIYAYQEEQVGLRAGELAERVIRNLLPPERAGHDPAPFDFAAELESLVRLAHRRALGPSTAALVRAAEARDIPWIRLNEGSLVQFGHGKFQKRIQATVTSETRHTAVEIASDKELTIRILSDLGLPVPRQFAVDDAEDAVDAAERLGYPVVVKPLDGNHGRGVSIYLETPDAVRTAWAKAAEISRTVLVETFQAGFDHRILVVGGKVVAVARRIPGHVVGDGRSTVAELVEKVNLDPRRGVGHEKILTRLDLDHQALRLLEQAGKTAQTVLGAGEIFYLRSTGNLSTGGTAIDCTDVIHYDNRILAERAVKAIGLDVGGVDFLTPDISQSWKDVGGAIVEINAAPGFRMHVSPSEGRSRDVAGPVLDLLFPPSTPTRIPIAAITGTNGKTTTTRMVGHIMKLAGHFVGMTTTDGIYIDGELTVAGDNTGPWSAGVVLKDPSVSAAVLETARGGILRSGLGYRKCTVGAVLNVAADHIGLRGVRDVDDLALVKRIVVEVAQETCVLNADDPRVVKMADHSPGRPIWVTMHPANELVKRTIRAGGRAVALERGVNGEMITLYEGEAHVPVLWTHQIPATIEGHARHNVQNAMFAVGITHGMGVSLENIRQGLRTFATSYFQTPGRLNIFDELPFRVILDFAHNAHGMTAIAQMVREMPTVGRRIGILAVPGDRRDDDIRELGRVAATAFDIAYLREDADRRGRDPGAIAKLIGEGLLEGGMAPERILLGPGGALDEPTVLDDALQNARPGDLVVLFGEKLERAWNQITSFGRDRAAVDPAAKAATAIVEAPPDVLPLPGEVAAMDGIPPSGETELDD